MALLNWPKNRYFIVSPTEAGISFGDTLWELCRTVARGRIADIYTLDLYDVIVTAGSKEEIKKAALKRHSKNPKII